MSRWGPSRDVSPRQGQVLPNIGLYRKETIKMPVDTQHLDLDQFISAAIDDVDRDMDQHLEMCRLCREQLDSWVAIAEATRVWVLEDSVTTAEFDAARSAFHRRLS